ncbi:MAG: hypothetical protein KF771_04010 [Burkholderiales bacterium]|nr:hypothetical protein [Burkholderiales bacterium]
MGLVIAGALALYLLITITVVIGAIRYAKKNGKSAKRWGCSAALVMYLIPFWDWIPTMAVHQYSCATEAGFWVYKTPEQWKKENPGVMETLISNRGQVRSFSGDNDNFVRKSLMNQRFVYISKHNGPLFLNRWRYEQQIVDSKTDVVMARSVDFSTSHQRRQAGWSGWKFWLDRQQCNTYENIDSGSLSTIAKQFEGAEK